MAWLNRSADTVLRDFLGCSHLSGRQFGTAVLCLNLTVERCSWIVQRALPDKVTMHARFTKIADLVCIVHMIILHNIQI